MKYEVKVKQIIINEMTIPVEADSAVDAMEKAEAVCPGHMMTTGLINTTKSTWSVSSVAEKSDES